MRELLTTPTFIQTTPIFVHTRLFGEVGKNFLPLQRPVSHPEHTFLFSQAYVFAELSVDGLAEFGSLATSLSQDDGASWPPFLCLWHTMQAGTLYCNLEQRSSRLYATPTHVARWRKAVQMYGFPTQAWETGKHAITDSKA